MWTLATLGQTVNISHTNQAINSMNISHIRSDSVNIRSDSMNISHIRSDSVKISNTNQAINSMNIRS